MGWREETATTQQLTTIQRFYEGPVSWVVAKAAVDSLIENKITKGQASDLIEELHDKRNAGKPTIPEGYKTDPETPSEKEWYDRGFEAGVEKAMCIVSTEASVNDGVNKILKFLELNRKLRR